MTRRYLEEEGDQVAVLEPGTYDVEVVSARAPAKAPTMIFLGLKVVNGPEAGRATEVGVHFPDDANSGAQYYWKEKVGAWRGIIRDAVGPGVSDEDELSVIAEALEGAFAQVTVGIQGPGQYEGKQELLVSKPLIGDDIPAAPVAATQTAAVETTTVKVADARPLATVGAAPTGAATASAPADDVPF